LLDLLVLPLLLQLLMKLLEHKEKESQEQLLVKREQEPFSQDLSLLVLQLVPLKEQQVLVLFLKEKRELVGVQEWDVFVQLWIQLEKLMKKMKNGSWIEDLCVDVDEFVSGFVSGREQEQEVCFLRWKFRRWG
jgi:hypothetical protein